MHDQSDPTQPNPTQPNPTNPILIVDDHAGTRDTYSTVLRLAGFLTATASTGQEGVRVAVDGHFTVANVDLNLPDISGLDVVREVKAVKNDLRMVVVTAFPTLNSSFDASGAAADGFVDGPLFGGEVVALVERALNGPYPVRHPLRGGVLPPSGQTDRYEAAIDPRIRTVLRVIDADLSRPWSIADFAAAVDLSESRLRSLFRACTGLSIAAFLRERRVQEAARRLRTTFDDVGQIAHDVGFPSMSLSDFRRVFGRRFRMPPTEYRARYWCG